MTWRRTLPWSSLGGSEVLALQKARFGSTQPAWGMQFPQCMVVRSGIQWPPAPTSPLGAATEKATGLQYCGGGSCEWPRTEGMKRTFIASKHTAFSRYGFWFSYLFIYFEVHKWNYTPQRSRVSRRKSWRIPTWSASSHQNCKRRHSAFSWPFLPLDCERNFWSTSSYAMCAWIWQSTW